MKIIILGGFLGSGKTTVLLQYAGWLVKHSTAEHPVIILENEISGAGVDNQLLEGADFTVKNIFAGCICCTSAGVLEQSVRKIEKEYDPEWLLVEATGMAYPDSIRKNLMDAGYPGTAILALADASRWDRVSRAMPDFIQAQMKDADVILLNKIDLADEKTVERIHGELLKLRTDAGIFRICATDEQPEKFWQAMTDRLVRGMEAEKHE